jgi:alpha/beta hydrolase family protein
VTDEVSFARDGRTYRVRGLQAKARSIGNGSTELDGMLDGRVGGARTALAQWRGRHAVIFAEEANGVLGKLAGLRVTMSQAANTLANFPGSGSSWASVRQQDEVYMGARVDVPADPGTSSARTADLRSYVATASGQDERFASLAALVNLDGVTAEVTYPRPLNEAERQRALDSGENPASVVGATTEQTDPVDPATLITLPRPQDQVPALVGASTSLNQYTSAVASAFDQADHGLLAFLAQDPAAIQARLSWLRADPRRWNQLSPAEQEILIEALPEDIGSMNGLPTVARDRANRIVLQRTKAALQARLAELEGMEPMGPANFPEPYVDTQTEEMEAIRAKLRGIERLEQRLAGEPGRPQAFLLGFSGDGNGRAIVALGNPDHAENVATYVPGTGSRLAVVGAELRRADAMALDANRLDPNNPTSVILWMDYDAPQDIPAATLDRYADNGAPGLRAFQEGLDVAHTRGGAYNTVVGHSYGTVVVGAAARGGGLDTDNLVLVASPGVNTGHASNLGLPPDRVFATTAPGDAIRHTPEIIHGTNPLDPGFGARIFTSENGSEGNAHSNYWDDGNEARDNMAAIITGNDTLVTSPPVPPPPPGPQPEPTPGPGPTAPGDSGSPSGPASPATPAPTPGPAPTPPR